MELHVRLLRKDGIISDMKYRDSEISGSGCDNSNVVHVLIEAVNAVMMQKAFDEYLKSTTHAYGQLATLFEKACRKEIRNIRVGRPSPHAPFSCCRECFVDLLSSKMQFTYAALDTELDGNDKAWVHVPINDAPDEHDTDELADFLIRKCHAEYVTAYVPALDDARSRNAYLDSFRELLRLSARLAKRLGEADAAKHLLEALAMTIGETSLDNSLFHRNATATLISRETADEIYSLASLGWRQLWAGVEYAALKPLPLKKASKRKA